MVLLVSADVGVSLLWVDLELLVGDWWSLPHLEGGWPRALPFVGWVWFNPQIERKDVAAKVLSRPRVSHTSWQYFPKVMVF